MKKGNMAAQVTMITQLGLSLVTPVLLCVFLAVWLKNHFQLGEWILILGIVSGIAAMALTFFKIYKVYQNEDEREEYPVQSNHHN